MIDVISEPLFGFCLNLPLPYQALVRQLEADEPTDLRCALGMYSLQDHLGNIVGYNKLCIQF